MFVTADGRERRRQHRECSGSEPLVILSTSARQPRQRTVARAARELIAEGRHHGTQLSHAFTPRSSQRDVARPRRQGKPGAEPPIDLDTMLDLTAAAEVDGIRFDGVDLFLFDPHVEHRRHRRRAEAPGRQDRRARTSSSARSSRPSGRRPAAARRWGATRTARSSSTQVRKACRIGREAARARRPASTASSASTRPSSPADWATDPEANTRRIAETFRAGLRHRRGATASGSPPRARSAGAACTAGGGWSSCWRWSTGPKTLGFQADMAHTLLYHAWATTRRRIASCRRTSTGTTATQLDAALSPADRRAAALDDRLPRRPERRAP